MVETSSKLHKQLLGNDRRASASLRALLYFPTGDDRLGPHRDDYKLYIFERKSLDGFPGDYKERSGMRGTRDNRSIVGLN